jgi:hypothetical protein
MGAVEIPSAPWSLCYGWMPLMMLLQLFAHVNTCCKSIDAAERQALPNGYRIARALVLMMSVHPLRAGYSSLSRIIKRVLSVPKTPPRPSPRLGRPDPSPPPGRCSWVVLAAGWASRAPGIHAPFSLPSILRGPCQKSPP